VTSGRVRQQRKRYGVVIIVKHPAVKLRRVARTPTAARDVVVVDLGTNAVRLSHARLRPGVGFRILREGREQTRLGGGRNGVLSSRAVTESVDAVAEFLDKVRRTCKPCVIAVATSAVRDARNAATLGTALRRRTGVHVSVLSGDDEARLGSLAAMWSLRLRDATVIDLGGGSLQISRIDAGVVGSVVSLPLGAVRLTRRYIQADPVPATAIAAIRRDAARHLAGRLPAATHALVGLGGTIRTLARVYLARRRRTVVHGATVPAGALRELCAELVSLPLRRRRKLEGLRADRADIIVAGALVIDEVLVRGGYRAITVCGRGLRHGVLLHETFGVPE
jgi:exopolyphosphatase/guanosine-5'-triphosphate,3'-diphosphate pyrophosphatase